MNAALHLLIGTPQQVLLELDDVVALRGEDDSGCFGLLPGHEDYLTALAPTVLRWRRGGGETGYCAVRGGVLSLSGGRELRIACRNGVLGDRLDTLEARVAALIEAEHDMECRARVEHMRLQTQTVRALMRYLRPGAHPVGEGTPPQVPP